MRQDEETREVRATFSLSRAEYVRAVRCYLRKSHLVSWVQVLFILIALAVSAVMGILMERMGFLNTLWIIIPPTVLGLFCSAISAYAFAKLRFKGKNWLF